MFAQGLACRSCDYETSLGNYYICPNCGYSLEVVYDYKGINLEMLRQMMGKCGSVWHYNMLLPVKNESSIVTINEGNTPLIKSIRVGPEKEIRLFFKDETRNPTGAFKDRPNTVGISMARDLGIETVTIASTGNGGASLSAYAAKAGMNCYVFIPEQTPSAKVVQAAVHGARIVKVKGHYDNSYNLALQASLRYNLANLTSTYLNPYTMEGDKTIAYELYFQMEGIVPDWIVVPLGAGAMLNGVFKGFEELRDFGLIQRLPKMIGVQAKGCSPITSAYERGLEAVEEWSNPYTVAGGICDPLTGYSQDGTRTLRVIRKSGGAGISVDDELIMQCGYTLAKKEAIFCEPASASSLAAIYSLIDKKIINDGDSVVAIITGHGLKDPEVFEEVVSGMVIEPELSAFEQAYNSVL